MLSKQLQKFLKCMNWILFYNKKTKTLAAPVIHPCHWNEDYGLELELLKIIISAHFDSYSHDLTSMGKCPKQGKVVLRRLHCLTFFPIFLVLFSLGWFLFYLFTKMMSDEWLAGCLLCCKIIKLKPYFGCIFSVN